MLKQILGLGLLTSVMLFPVVSWSQPCPPPPMPGGGQFMLGPGGAHHGPGKGMGMGRWWEHPEVQKKLELTPEQVEKLGTQRLGTETKMIEVGSKMKIAQLYLRDLVSKKDATDEDINKKIDEIGDLQKEQMRAAIGQARAIRTILNEDQQKKVENFLKNRQERVNRGPRFKDGPGGGWADRPWGKDGKGEKGNKGHGMDGERGKGRGEGRGPGGPGGRGFGMAPDGEMAPPEMNTPGGPDGQEFGGPAEPPMGPGAPGQAPNGDEAGAPVPPEEQFGWGGNDLDPGFLMDEFTTIDEPLENILADFE